MIEPMNQFHPEPNSAADVEQGGSQEQILSIFADILQPHGAQRAGHWFGISFSNSAGMLQSGMQSAYSALPSMEW